MRQLPTGQGIVSDSGFVATGRRFCGPAYWWKRGPLGPRKGPAIKWASALGFLLRRSCRMSFAPAQVTHSSRGPSKRDTNRRGSAGNARPVSSVVGRRGVFVYHRGRERPMVVASLLAMAAPSLARQTSPPDQSAAAAQAPPQAPAAPPAQGPIDATGWVKTTDGSPVPGSTLRLTNTDTRQIWVSWTDPTGKLTFRHLRPATTRSRPRSLALFLPRLKRSFPTLRPSRQRSSSPCAWPHSRSSPLPPNRINPSAAADKGRMAARQGLARTQRMAVREALALPAAELARVARAAAGEEGSFLRVC